MLPDIADRQGTSSTADPGIVGLFDDAEEDRGKSKRKLMKSRAAAGVDAAFARAWFRAR